MLAQYLADFVSLIYPQLCMACGKSLIHQEKTICTTCLYSLPYADFYKYPDNKVSRQFWGRVKVEQALAIWLFNKGSQVQQLMHRLKYKHAREVGFLLGELAGKKLCKIPWFQLPDAIIPVPLNKAKQQLRGYNQSEILAKGMADVLGLPLLTGILLRTGKAKSQTTKSRYQRYENMQGQFILENKESLTGKHVLLVDDIITTGATLEACIQVLSQEHIKVSVCAAAYSE